MKTIIANVHLVSMDEELGEIEKAYIMIEDDKIQAIGEMADLEESLLEGADYIDGSGHYAYPGFVDAHTHLGMFNDHLRWEGSDGNELTNPVTPELRAIDSIFHDDVPMDEAIAGGVTTVMTGPGSGNVIGGQFAVIKPYGPSVDEMLVLAPAAMKAALGENPKGVYGTKNQKPQTRMGSAAVLREALAKAKHYMQKQEHETDENKRDFDFQMEALVPVLKRELILKIHAHRADDILTAIRIANEFGVRYTIDHCTEGYLVLDILEDEYAKRDVAGHGSLEGIIVGPLVGDRSKPELTRKWTGSAAAIYETGIPMAIATDHPVIPIDHGVSQAALLMRDGLTRQAALEGITTAAAKILGLEDRVGRLAVGLDADIVLWKEDPLLPWSSAKIVFVNGVLAYEE